MAEARKRPKPKLSAQVIDFDEGVVEACPSHVRDELRAEVDMLTSAFAQAENPAALNRMARSLIRGSCQDPEQRLHARRLAAMLRLRAKSLNESI